MARIGKLPVMAATAVATPEDSSFVLAFIDSTSGKLSWKKSDGNVVVITSA